MLKLCLIGNDKLFDVLKPHTENIELTFCSPKRISILNNQRFFREFDIIVEHEPSDPSNRNIDGMNILRTCQYYFPKLNMLPRYFKYNDSMILSDIDLKNIEKLKYKLKKYYQNNLEDLSQNSEYSLFVVNYRFRTTEHFKNITGINFLDFIKTLQSKIKTKILFSFKPKSEDFMSYKELSSLCDQDKNFGIISTNKRPIQYLKNSKYSFSMNSYFIMESLLLFNKPAFYIKNIKKNIYGEGNTGDLLNNTIGFEKFYLHHNDNIIYIPDLLCEKLSVDDINECNKWLYQYIYSSFREDGIEKLLQWIKCNARFENCKYDIPNIDFSKLMNEEF